MTHFIRHDDYDVVYPYYVDSHRRYIDNSFSIEKKEQKKEEPKKRPEYSVVNELWNDRIRQLKDKENTCKELRVYTTDGKHQTLDEGQLKKMGLSDIKALKAHVVVEIVLDYFGMTPSSKYRVQTTGDQYRTLVDFEQMQKRTFLVVSRKDETVN